MEAKYRKTVGLLNVLRQARKEARLEGCTACVTVTQENHQGFGILVHSDDLDEFVRLIVNNRGLHEFYREEAQKA